MSDPYIKQEFAKKWQIYREQHFEDLKDSVRQYSCLIRGGLASDHFKWGQRRSSGNANADLAKTLNWLDNRATWIDNYLFLV